MLIKSVLFLFSAAKIRVRIDTKRDKIPKHVIKVMEEEFTKLEMLEENYSDFDLTYNYLHWLTVLPWGNFRFVMLHAHVSRRVITPF